jgi:hypothetical protein
MVKTLECTTPLLKKDMFMEKIDPSQKQPSADDSSERMGIEQFFLNETKTFHGQN